MWITTLALATLSSPATPLLVTEPTRDDHGKLAWFEGSYKNAIRAAKTEDKLVFVDFWTTWCGWCKKLDKDTFSADSVVAEMKDLICVNLDAEGMEGGPVARSFGVGSYPALVFLASDGRAEDLISGYLAPDEFLVELRRIKSGKNTISYFRKRFEKDPTDLDARYQYALKIRRVGGQKEHDEQMAEIERLDPDGKSIPRQRIVMEKMLKAAVEEYRSRQEFDAAPVVEFLSESQHDLLRYEGWSTLANLYEQLAMAKECVAAYAKAWPHCPEDKVASFGNSLAWSHWELREELSGDQKSFALEVARKASAAAPDNINTLDTLACCAYMNGRTDEAREIMQRCIDLEPDQPQWKLRIREFK